MNIPQINVNKIHVISLTSSFNNDPLDGDQNITQMTNVKMIEFLVDKVVCSLLFQVARSMEFHW